MEKENLFLTPIADALDLAVSIAQEALDEKPGTAAEKAYQAQLERLAKGSGLTPGDVDTLGAPKTLIGRLFEYLQDWWWDKFSAAKDNLDDEEAAIGVAFAFPVPLLQTHPLEETPFEYDEIDQHIAAATADIAAAISQRTGWTPVRFHKPEPDGEVFDPVEQVLAVWKTQANAALLVLVEQFEEDPKLMGRALGLVHLSGTPASFLAARLRSNQLFGNML